MKTQRVRIAVLVAPDGTYNAIGWGGPEDYRNSMTDTSHLIDGMPSDVTEQECRLVWVEADVPVPEAPVVEGRVVE